MVLQVNYESVFELLFFSGNEKRRASAAAVRRFFEMLQPNSG
jgi:hypothetical protein